MRVLALTKALSRIMAASPSAQEFLNLLLSNEDGLPDEQIRKTFGNRYVELAPIINHLLRSNRIQIFNHADGSLHYKGVKEEFAVKFAGLGPEQILVYQAIERSGNKGIWTRDIKTTTNISQNIMNKTLKILEQRNLIKSVRSVVSKTKKLYMCFDLTPAKEITGGPWYSDQEFDREFVELLSNMVVKIISQGGIIDLPTIATRLRTSGIVKVELTDDELELVVNTLIYDYRVEEVQSSVLHATGHAVTAGRKFKACHNGDKALTIADSFLTEIPCGTCPVINQCSTNGIINPQTCEYYTNWLAMIGLPSDGGEAAEQFQQQQNMMLSDW